MGKFEANIFLAGVALRFINKILSVAVFALIIYGMLKYFNIL